MEMRCSVILIIEFIPNDKKWEVLPSVADLIDATSKVEQRLQV